MGEVALGYKAAFKLHIRCDNCMRESIKAVNVPFADDAPMDPEDLIDSAFLRSIPYYCRPCSGVIGRLFKIELV
ncbi:hypothetical protein [Rhizobium leguminosarum]|uniref:hypothetical protein n=1 Tax=Rhizobium leguminosarum TaxID=384 RepID=UPI00103EFB13|nr:hypothetical protein [Rhizobium leguminosarum]TBY40866.1 hypothetical protein E0H54_31760 [Rhizobium leguminosarum bv. viciae]